MASRKSIRKAYRKILKLRKVHYKEAVEYIINSEAALEVVDNGLFDFKFNDFEKHYFDSRLKAIDEQKKKDSNKSQGIHSILKTLINEMDEVIGFNEDYTKEIVRGLAKRKLRFYSELKNDKNRLNINFDLILEKMFNKENIDSFENSTHLNNSNLVLNELLNKIASKMESQIDYFLYDSIFFYLTEELKMGNKSKITYTTFEEKRVPKIIDTPYRFTFNNYNKTEDFLNEYTGHLVDSITNFTYPEKYIDVCYANIMSFFNFVFKNSITEYCKEKGIEAKDIRGSRVFNLYRYDFLAIEIISKIKSLYLEDMFFMYNMEDLKVKYIECDIKNKNEKKFLIEIEKLLSRINNKNIEQDLFIINDHQSSKSFKMMKSRSYGLFDRKEDIVSELLSNYKNQLECCLIVKEEVHLSIDGINKILPRYKGFYIRDRFIVNMTKEQIDLIRDNELLVEFKI